MYDRSFFAHTNPDGDNPWDRAVEAGFCSPFIVGENIAAGHPSVAVVQDGWENSPGHNANMLHESLVFVGMGYYESPFGTKYWVQLFGTPRR